MNFGSIFKNSFAHSHVASNVMLKFQKKLTSSFEFLRPQENVTPDRILARLKSPFPYGRGIKIMLWLQHIVLCSENIKHFKNKIIRRLDKIEKNGDQRHRFLLGRALFLSFNIAHLLPSSAPDRKCGPARPVRSRPQKMVGAGLMWGTYRGQLSSFLPDPRLLSLRSSSERGQRTERGALSGLFSPQRSATVTGKPSRREMGHRGTRSVEAIDGNESNAAEVLARLRGRWWTSRLRRDDRGSVSAGRPWNRPDTPTHPVFPSSGPARWALSTWDTPRGGWRTKGHSTTLSHCHLN